MKTWKGNRILLIPLVPLALICLMLVVSSCAPMATELKESITKTEAPVVEEPAPAEPEETALEGETTLPTMPLAPTVPEDSAVGEQPEEPAELLPSPTSPAQATALPPIATAPAIPTPTPIVEERLVEVEWPPTMRLGESDVIRLALIPSQAGYVVQTEYPEHQVVTETLKIERPGGYELFAVARLDGVGFEIAPGGDLPQYMAPDQVITWRWSLTPESAGQQRLLVHLTLRWQPTSDQGSVRQVVAYSQGLDVNVISFFGLNQLQTMFAGLFGLIFGGGLSLIALVVMRPQARRLMQISDPNPALTIELPPGLAISAHERAILQSLFQRYGRLVVKDEFLSGYSGARTFLALPVRPDGRADAYTIAKLGERTAIQREYENYEVFVKDTLPPITARIQQPPVTTSAPSQGAQLAALQYTFIGQPGSTPTSLRQALLETPDPELLYTLFDTFGPSWWMQRRPYTFRLGQEYDRLLPTHLVVEPAEGRAPVLSADTSPAGLGLAVDDLISLRGFQQIELRADGRSLSLRGAQVPGQPPLRVRWLSPVPPAGSAGRVIDTRWTLLRQYTSNADLFGLPDPIPRLPEWLSETTTGGQSTIHGDLNLENILVGPGNLVWLIDFAQTRDGHTLYDFAHLEAEIVAHVISPQIHNPRHYLELMENPRQGPFSDLIALRQAVENIASRCLFNPSQPREYQLALTLACLGALKFANIDDHARHMLYLTAAFQAQSL